MHQYKKHPRSCPNCMIDGIEFFLFTIVFLQPFALFLCYFRPSLLNPFSHYILWFLYHFLHPRMSQVLGVLFLCSPLPLLEPSALSYKATCLLFRHHLHINAARELAGQHLMRRWQYFQIFVIPHPYPLSGICPSPCRKVPLIRCIKGLRRFPATSDRGSEMVIILGQG